MNTLLRFWAREQWWTAAFTMHGRQGRVDVHIAYNDGPLPRVLYVVEDEGIYEVPEN